MNNLEYAIVDITDKSVIIQITEQKEICEESCTLIKFKATNGIIICSHQHPAWSSYGEHKLYIRGWQIDLDLEKIVIPIEMWPKVYIAIKEYNKKKHTIVIDGKTIEISEESFEALKKSFKD